MKRSMLTIFYVCGSVEHLLYDTVDDSHNASIWYLMSIHVRSVVIS